MAVNLTTLKAELADAKYTGKTDEQVADMLAVRDRQANRESLSGGLLMASVVRAELAALTAADQNYVRTLAACDDLPLTANLKTELGAVFGAGTATRTNLLALLKRPGTRAEELDLGGQPTSSDVANARRI